MGSQVLPFPKEKNGQLLLTSFKHGSYEELSIPKVSD